MNYKQLITDEADEGSLMALYEYSRMDTGHNDKYLQSAELAT